MIHAELWGWTAVVVGCAGLCGQPSELLLCKGWVLGAGARQAMEAHALEGQVCAVSLEPPAAFTSSAYLWVCQKEG